MITSHALRCQHFSIRPPAHRLELSRRFADAFRQQVVPYTRWDVEDDPATLRVAVIAGGLWKAPLSVFIEDVFQHLDKRRVLLYAYPAFNYRDEVTWRLREHCYRWTPIWDRDDEAAARLIHEDRPHILLDCLGHMMFARPGVLARKPAPVTAGWLEYLATSGIPGSDAIIGDPHVTPPEEEGLYAEDIWRMPESYQCFTPPHDAPPVAVLPALKEGLFTFGGLHQTKKLNSGVIALWAEILRAVPESRVLLKSETHEDRGERGRLTEAFRKHGVAPERVVFEPPSDRRGAMDAYGRMDLVLDPFPYNGATTSCEALWMGVPVLTLKGDRFLAHCGESICRNVGLEAFVAAHAVEYVQQAVWWTQHLPELAALRYELRERMRASPVCDAERYARHFATLLFAMYRHYRGQREENHG